jgi:hypothetical protein
MGKTMLPHFNILAYHASQVTDARLDTSNGINLILGEYGQPNSLNLSRLSALDTLQDGGATPLIRFPERPGWDAIPADEDHWCILSYHIGSVVVPLVAQTSGGAEPAYVDNSNRHGIFMCPRFLRHSGAHPVITAVNLDADYQITLYQPQADGQYSSPQILPAPEPGILQDTHLVAVENGYWLFTQRFVPGPYRQYQVDHADILLNVGIVEARRLDQAFKPVGQVWRPFADQSVLQFDADALNGRLAVFATTVSGWQLTLTASEDTSHFALSSPSVVLENSGMLLSLLADAGTDQAKLWLAKQ